MLCPWINIVLNSPIRATLADKYGANVVVYGIMIKRWRKVNFSHSQGTGMEGYT